MDQPPVDLVVIGAGGAGLPAALTALESGLKQVIVLEKRSRVGGNAAMSGGFLFALNSGPQQAVGLKHEPDEVFRDTMAYNHYDGVEPELIRLWVDEADASVEWLENIGVAYRPMQGKDLGVEPSGWPNHPGSFVRVTDLMKERVEDLGGRVIVRASVTGLVADPAGGVSGVLLDTPDGPVTIHTRAVVLATGGFTGNVDLLNEHFADIYDQNVYWTDAKPLTGDGIALAAEAGAAVNGETALLKENCYSFKTKKNMPNRGSTEPRSLWVNQRGERFLDESQGFVNATTNALIRQPGMSGFALFDDDLIQTIIDTPNPFEVELRPGEEDPSAWTAQGYRATLRDQLSDPSNSEWCTAADDWDGIAKWIGSTPHVLRRTVDQYNAACEEGRDALWAKDPALLVPLLKPPFYVLRFRPLMVDTAGPVKVDDELRVLDEENQPVPGLYAAGSLTSGWVGFDEYHFGTPLSWAISSGRRAGAAAAAAVLTGKEASSAS
jgi:fumarate reductase flavoprotein subunit